MSNKQELLEEIRQIKAELVEIKSYMVDLERNTSFLAEVKNLLNLIISRLR